jgi:multiple sugar transport system permease protein
VARQGARRHLLRLRDPDAHALSGDARAELPRERLARHPQHPLGHHLPGAFAPFSVFLLTKFMRRIPVSLIESAKLDGAGEWHVFWDICLPQCRSALYSIAILVFIDNWNMVEQPLILLPNADAQPLSVFLSTINTGEVGIAFAAAVIYMVPGLLLFLHGEAYLVEGITYSGSVKG